MIPPWLLFSSQQPEKKRKRMPVLPHRERFTETTNTPLPWGWWRWHCAPAPWPASHWRWGCAIPEVLFQGISPSWPCTSLSSHLCSCWTQSCGTWGTVTKDIGLRDWTEKFLCFVFVLFLHTNACVFSKANCLHNPLTEKKTQRNLTLYSVGESQTNHNSTLSRDSQQQHWEKTNCGGELLCLTKRQTIPPTQCMQDCILHPRFLFIPFIRFFSASIGLEGPWKNISRAWPNSVLKWFEVWCFSLGSFWKMLAKQQNTWLFLVLLRGEAFLLI